MREQKNDGAVLHPNQHNSLQYYEEQHRNIFGSPFMTSDDDEDMRYLYTSELWSKLHTDYSRYPHLLRVDSLRSVFERLESTDLPGVSAKMRLFTQQALVRTTARWTQVLEMLLAPVH